MRIVCFSEIQWRYTRTRKQQILTRLPKEWEILFLSSVTMGARNNLRPERDGGIVHACVPVFKNFPQRSLMFTFARRPVRFVWNAVLLAWVSWLIRRTGFDTPERVFYVSNIYYAAVLPFLKRRAMIYDCNDDHLAFPNTPAWAPAYFRRLVRSADMGIAVSRTLAERLRGTGLGNIHIISNGVDNELIAQAANRPAPRDVRELPRPIIGYSGAIAPWFDFDLLEMVATALPAATLMLIGPVFRDTEHRLQGLLSSRPNVKYLGLKPHEELGSYLAAMDVCIVPLVMNDLMQAANPNKLYEYAAVGKPIVTMRHSADLDELAGLISLASSREEFVRMTERALTAPAQRERLVAFARANDWQHKADAVAQLILRATTS